MIDAIILGLIGAILSAVGIVVALIGEAEDV